MEMSNIDFSSILEMVNTFYTNAWYLLIAVLGVATLVLPVVLKKFLDYRTKIEIDKLEENLKKQFQNLSDENEKLITEKAIETAIKSNEATDKKFDDVNKKLDAQRGLSWHTLGIMYFEKENYKLALQFYFYAFDSYFYGKDEMNMQKIMDCIKTTYQDVKNLSLLKEIEVNHPNLIEKLDGINENHRYSNLIDGMNEELNNLKQRLKVSKK